MGVVIQEFEVSPAVNPPPAAKPPAADTANGGATKLPVIDAQRLAADCRARALRLFAH